MATIGETVQEKVSTRARLRSDWCRSHGVSVEKMNQAEFEQDIAALLKGARIEDPSVLETMPYEEFQALIQTRAQQLSGNVQHLKSLATSMDAVGAGQLSDDFAQQARMFGLAAAT